MSKIVGMDLSEALLAYARENHRRTKSFNGDGGLPEAGLRIAIDEKVSEYRTRNFD